MKVGTDAAQEAGRIGTEAVGEAPNILDKKVKFLQGLGQTLADTSGTVRQVSTVVENVARTAISGWGRTALAWNTVDSPPPTTYDFFFSKVWLNV